MRIVQINGGAKGSTGKIMMGIADIAKLQGHEVMCASPITSTNRDAGKNCGYYRIGGQEQGEGSRKRHRETSGSFRGR